MCVHLYVTCVSESGREGLLQYWRVVILGDPGADSGNEAEKRGKKYDEEK